MTTTTELIYAYDPLCGWCYGFAPAFNALRVRLGDRVRFTVASAGLFTGGRICAIGTMTDYLHQGMKMVEQRTGVRFGDPFRHGLLEQGTWRMDSEPSCRAMRIAQDLDPSRLVDFSQGLCSALYGDGLPIDDPQVIGDVAQAHGYDRDALLRAWEAPDAKQATFAWFDANRRLGLRGYPTIYLRDASGVRVLSEGALPLHELERRFAPLL